MKPMSPRRAAATIVLMLGSSVVFYSWLLYAAFGVPIVWVAIVMGLASFFISVSAFFGYQRWLIKNTASDRLASVVTRDQVLSQPRLPTNEQLFSAGMLAVWGIVTPIVFVTTFLIDRRFKLAITFLLLSVVICPWTIRRIKLTLR
jgi:hypothetical protein